MPISVDASFLCAAHLQASRNRVPRGVVATAPRPPSDAVVVLISGTIRIEHQGTAALPRVLHRITGGEACILPAGLSFGRGDPSLRVIAETDLDLLFIPQAAFDRLMTTSARFRGLVFRANAIRMLGLMQGREGLPSGSNGSPEPG